MKRWHFMAIAGLLLGAAAAQAAQVGLIKIDGAIGPATASYIARAVDVAAAQHDECLIIQLDTPGGLLDSASGNCPEILRLESAHRGLCRAGSGASAGSAGVFITMAADVAAMAPAHPHRRGASG